MNECEERLRDISVWFRNHSDDEAKRMSESLRRMAEYAKAGSFQEATAEYLKASIGNRAWVAGVGNCFIQERSGNDKIREVGHVMNDPVVRGFMRCVKRLLSKAQQLAKPER